MKNGVKAYYRDCAALLSWLLWFRLTLPLGFHQNRVVGFPRLTRQELTTSRRKVRACEPLNSSIMYPPYGLPQGGVILHRGLTS
jgi:hypothetical protein